MKLSLVKLAQSRYFSGQGGGWDAGWVESRDVTFACFSQIRYSTCLIFVLSSCRITANRLLTALRALFLSIYLPLQAPGRAGLPDNCQGGNYFTHLQGPRLSQPGDREVGNYLTHFMGQKIIVREEYDSLNASFLA